MNQRLTDEDWLYLFLEHSRSLDFMAGIEVKIDSPIDAKIEAPLVVESIDVEEEIAVPVFSNAEKRISKYARKDIPPIYKIAMATLANWANPAKRAALEDLVARHKKLEGEAQNLAIRYVKEKHEVAELIPVIQVGRGGGYFGTIVKYKEKK